MTTTTATASPRQRKPRPKPQRSIRLSVPLNAEGRNGLVSITVGKQTDEYYVSRIPADFGKGFSLEKLGSDDVYCVNIDGQKHTCECKGHARHGHCKHADGLAALIVAGKL
jgi:hypothetical protein